MRLYNYIKRLIHKESIPYGTILMLHRIDTPNANGILYNEHLKMSPVEIEKMVTYARNKGCKFTSLEEIIRPHHFWECPRKLIAITLDDGYRDNYINGLPTFKKLNVPFCIYVCTKMVKGEMLYWWEILEWLLVKNDNISIYMQDGSKKSFDCSTQPKKEQSFLEIRELILKLPQKNLVGHLKRMFADYDIDYSYGNDSLGLTWEQLRELANEPLCTIGNHTYSHEAFIGCSDEEIKEDIAHAAYEMKENAGIEMKDFAFPFGEATAVAQHDIELVKELGFKTSATTKDGLICYGTDSLELPRLFVTEKNWKDVIDKISTYG